MYIFKIFLVIIIILVLNKFLSIVRKNMEIKSRVDSISDSIISRKDLVELGMDYYLTLCKYIIIKKGISKEVYIQDITGREIVDIKFTDIQNREVYVSCLLKDFSNEGEFDSATYDEILDLLSFMIKDDINKGIIFCNSSVENKAIEFIKNLNKNSKKYNIEIIDGYEIIKFARRRNESTEERFKYA